MKCLTCKHFDFRFQTDYYSGDLSVEFLVDCERQHFMLRTEDDTDTTELHNTLVAGFSCKDYERFEKICIGCGKRGHENNVWCPTCKKPFDKKVERVTCT